MRSGTRRSTRPARVLLLAYSAFLAVALLSPSNHEQSQAVVWVVHRLVDLGFSPSAVTFHRVEVLMNVVIVAPVTFLGGLVVPRLSWRDWTAYGFLAAVAVELVQGILLPGREASFSDVVANTAGALLGALLVHRIRPMMRSTRFG